MCERFRFSSKLIPEQRKEEYIGYEDLIPIVEKYQFATICDVENDIWNSTESNIDKFYDIKLHFKNRIKDNMHNIIPDGNKYDYIELLTGDNPYRNGVEKWESQGVFSSEECLFVLTKLHYIIATLNLEYKKIKALFAENSVNSPPESIPNNTLPKFETLSSLFTVKNYDTFLDVLTEVEPQLLIKESGTYLFCGSQSTQKGCVAAYIKQLKNKGVVNQNANRNEIAKILSNEIKEYSIKGATIDSKSSTYSDVFESQIDNLLSKLNKI